MIILFNGFYCFCMFVSKHFVKRVRPKKSTLVSRNQPGEIFLSFRRPHSRMCIFKFKKKKEIKKKKKKKKKKMTKRQNKLRRKKRISVENRSICYTAAT